MKVRGLVGMVLVRERIWVMHSYKSSKTEVEGGVHVRFMLTLVVKFKQSSTIFNFFSILVLVD